MPYADLPVTRAMQPLKLKEYLATGKPVVVRRLPSTDAWSDCLDVAETAPQFSRLVRERIATGITQSQSTARRRLQHESWRSKAAELENLLNSKHDITTSINGKPQATSFEPPSPEAFRETTGSSMGKKQIPVGGATGQQ